MIKQTKKEKAIIQIGFEHNNIERFVYYNYFSTTIAVRIKYNNLITSYEDLIILEIEAKKYSHMLSDVQGLKLRVKGLIRDLIIEGAHNE
jgi:hypothetical protein